LELTASGWLRLTVLGNFGNSVSFLHLARSPLPVGRVDYVFEASSYSVSEIAFDPLTLAAVRLPGAEALSGEFFSSSRTS
jgi:hypothetical protein